MERSPSAPVRAAWFHKARYGMFVHWGPYAVGARDEWVMNRERIPKEEYAAHFVSNWHAESFDPAAWAALAVEGGMKYVVLTARHHDGFALWDTATTDWNAVRQGPRRDLVAPFVEAVRAAGLRVGLYYSFADWTHPDYPDAFARDWPQAWASEDAREHFIAFTRAQLRELLTHYGRIDVLWYDGCFPAPTGGDETNAMVRALQPDILINNRNGGAWDFHCCEQTIRPAEPGVPWEACMTLNGNWGFHAGDHDWKPASAIVSLLCETAGSAGNLLLNVGPRGDGSIPAPCADTIRAAGRWLARNEEAIRGSERHPFAWINSGKITARGNMVYVHFFHRPGGEFCIAEIANRVMSARWLDGGAPVAFEQRIDGRIFLKSLPDPLPDPAGATIVFELDGPPRALRERTTFWIPE